MLINPNNHALDGGPATARMEREVTAQLAAMFGFGTHLGHLTTSGTIANLEALFVARELHPGRGIAFSADAHYTHSRMCGLLGIEGRPVAVDRRGRMDLDALEELLRTGRVGTVVLTAGTTGLGAIDPIHEALGLCRQHGARIHVDAAYGGFFTTAGRARRAPGTALPRAAPPGSCRPRRGGPSPSATRWWWTRTSMGCSPTAAAPCCSAIPGWPGSTCTTRRTPTSPPRTCTSGRSASSVRGPGAAAAALWLTFRLLPPTPDGLGQVLAAGRRAALAWSALIGKSAVLDLYQQPELDIVSYFPVTEPAALSRIDQASERILQAGMTGPDPVFLSTLRADAGAFLARHGSVRDGRARGPHPAQRADETGSRDLPAAPARAGRAARARLSRAALSRASLSPGWRPRCPGVPISGLYRDGDSLLYMPPGRASIQGSKRFAPPDGTLVKISDVARHADVSPSTVSYVLSGKRSISERTRRRVLDSIATLGYRPHAGARALASSRSNVIALVVPLRSGILRAGPHADRHRGGDRGPRLRPRRAAADPGRGRQPACNGSPAPRWWTRSS